MTENPQLFEGFQVNPDLKQPATSLKQPPNGQNARKRRRFTLNKVRTDGFRQNIKMIEEAIKNTVTLNFRMSDFQSQKGKFTLSQRKLYPGLQPQTVSMSGGSKLFVDLDGVIVFAYFPGYITEHMQAILLHALSELVKVNPPKPDTANGDRRSTRKRPKSTNEATEEEVYEGEENQAEADGHSSDLDFNPESSNLEDSQSVDEEAEVALNDDEWEDISSELIDDLSQLEREGQLACLYRQALAPSSFYWAPGWYGTGQENKHLMSMSSQMRQALQHKSRAMAIRFLKAKLEFDSRISHLTSILHWPLFRALKGLRSHMRRLPGPVGNAVSQGWASPFPCMAIGFNRTTGIHRDSNGFRNGLDVIGVLGQLRKGHLSIPNLGLRFEWEPGCLGAFDGYDLAHEVEEWDGLYRVTVISFCRSSSWRGLKLPLNVSAPTLVELKVHLEQAAQDKKEAGKAIASKHKRNHNSTSNPVGRGGRRRL